MDKLKLLPSKKNIIWMGDKPYASETYYCLKDDLSLVASALKETAYQYLKPDENKVIMNFSTFKKLLEFFESKDIERRG